MHSEQGQEQGDSRLWPGMGLPSAEEARQEWERRIAVSPTVPTGASPTVSPCLPILQFCG